MSQPPQQPGPYGGQPPGYGYQPAPGQGPGGYPQQGGYPQSGGYPQQGGYPQSGPQPQQQPGGYGAYDQYGQTPQYGYPDPYGGAPRKSKLPWILAGGGVVVIAAVVVLILVLTGGSDTSSPQGVAEAAVKAFNDRSANEIKDIACDKAGSADDDFNDIPKDLKAELGEVKESGDSATAKVKLTAQGQTITITLHIAKQNGSWCVTNDTGLNTGTGS